MDDGDAVGECNGCGQAAFVCIIIHLEYQSGKSKFCILHIILLNLDKTSYTLSTSPPPPPLLHVHPVHPVHIVASMNSTTDVQTLQDSLKSALLATTRTTTEVCAEDLAFHRSLDPSIASTLDAHNARLLSLAERLLRSGAQSTDVVGPKLQDSDALETNWRGVVDVVDSLLERVDTTLDEVKGIVKRGLDNAPHVCLLRERINPD